MKKHIQEWEAELAERAKLLSNPPSECPECGLELRKTSGGKLHDDPTGWTGLLMCEACCSEQMDKLLECPDPDYWPNREPVGWRGK